MIELLLALQGARLLITGTSKVAKAIEDDSRWDLPPESPDWAPPKVRDPLAKEISPSKAARHTHDYEVARNLALAGTLAFLLGVAEVGGPDSSLSIALGVTGAGSLLVAIFYPLFRWLRRNTKTALLAEAEENWVALIPSEVLTWPAQATEVKIPLEFPVVATGKLAFLGAKAHVGHVSFKDPARALEAVGKIAERRRKSMIAIERYQRENSERYPVLRAWATDYYSQLLNSYEGALSTYRHPSIVRIVSRFRSRRAVLVSRSERALTAFALADVEATPHTWEQAVGRSQPELQ